MHDLSGCYSSSAQATLSPWPPWPMHLLHAPLPQQPSPMHGPHLPMLPPLPETGRCHCCHCPAQQPHSRGSPVLPALLVLHAPAIESSAFLLHWPVPLHGMISPWLAQICHLPKPLSTSLLPPRSLPRLVTTIPRRLPKIPVPEQSIRRLPLTIPAAMITPLAWLLSA